MAVKTAVVAEARKESRCHLEEIFFSSKILQVKPLNFGQNSFVPSHAGCRDSLVF